MREFWVDADGVQLFGIEVGSGPVIVMLHGGLADHQAVLPYVAPLSERYRVITPDLRASGRSWCGTPLTFDRLADDVDRLLDYAATDRAVVGGVSSGSGVAMRYALRYPSRTLGLVVTRPVYAGAARGYTEDQEGTFATMDSVASRALVEGVQVLRPLYANLAPGVRERALAMIDRFDPASVVATSRFLASGAQPFADAHELRSLNAPTLLVRGDDPMHPAEVSDLYAANIPNCTAVPASTSDVADVIGTFIERCLHTAA